MQIDEAIALIQHDSLRSITATRWADLGCGSGLFTRALAHFQPPGSSIYAVDTINQSLADGKEIGGVIIKPIRQDFVRDPWHFADLDGILMANSLHYVQDKPTFIRKAIRHLTESGVFLLVEYDSDTPNPWVPCPLSFDALTNLFTGLGFSQVEKLYQKPSMYGRANLYSARVSR